MSLSLRDRGDCSSVLERLRRQRLPRLVSLRKSVDQGDVLGGLDLSFLDACISEVRNYQSFAELNPELHVLLSEVSSLYHHITEKSLQNKNETLML